MQDTSNTPNSDVNSPNTDKNSDISVERKNEETPTPPDQPRNIPVEEPPESDKPAIEEDGDPEPQMIV